MLAYFRHFAATWPARVFFLVLVAAFGSWGISDVVRNLGSGSNAVATVQGHDITPAQFTQQYDAALRRYTQQLPDPTQVPQMLKERVAVSTLQRLVAQQALADQVARMGIVAPDQAVRDAVFAIPAFKGTDGTFSRAQMQQVLEDNHLSETEFLNDVHKDVAQNQLLQTIAASTGVSQSLADLTFVYFKETRTADIAVLPFAGQPLPAPPSDAVLKRYYDNHPERYTAPEYRHIKAVILSPETIGKSLPVSDAEIKAYFEAHKSDYVTEEKRALHVITAPDMVSAQALADKWKAGATWQKMQDAAKAVGATAVDLPLSTKAQIPSPELAKAAFAANDGTVQGPLKEPLGAQVFRVMDTQFAKNPSLDSLHDALRNKVASEKALDLIDARAQKLQDLFAGGAKMDEVPGDLGAVGAAGTLDAKGLTPEGEPAPIPAPDDLKKLIIDAAFKTNPGDPISPVEGPSHAWYAVSVDSITKPAKKPFDTVRAAVLADWQADQVRHKQETEAARLVTLVKNGQTLSNAAWGSGLTVTRTKPLKRGVASDNLTAGQVEKIFALKLHEAAMLETPAGFLVVQLAGITMPDPKADPDGVAQARQGVASALHDDYLTIYAAAVEQQAHPTIRMNVVQNLIQQSQ